MIAPASTDLVIGRITAVIRQASADACRDVRAHHFLEGLWGDLAIYCPPGAALAPAPARPWPAWCAPYLAALRTGHTRAEAARVAQISASRAAQFHQQNPAFAEAAAAARATGGSAVAAAPTAPNQTPHRSPISHPGPLRDQRRARSPPPDRPGPLPPRLAAVYGALERAAQPVRARQVFDLVGGPYSFATVRAALVILHARGLATRQRRRWAVAAPTKGVSCDHP